MSKENQIGRSGVKIENKDKQKDNHNETPGLPSVVQSRSPHQRHGQNARLKIHHGFVRMNRLSQATGLIWLTVILTITKTMTMMLGMNHISQAVTVGFQWITSDKRGNTDDLRQWSRAMGGYCDLKLWECEITVTLKMILTLSRTLLIISNDPLLMAMTLAFGKVMVIVFLFGKRWPSCCISLLIARPMKKYHAAAGKQTKM